MHIHVDEIVDYLFRQKCMDKGLQCYKRYSAENNLDCAKSLMTLILFNIIHNLLLLCQKQLLYFIMEYFPLPPNSRTIKIEIMLAIIIVCQYIPNFFDNIWYVFFFYTKFIFIVDRYIFIKI